MKRKKIELSAFLLWPAIASILAISLRINYWQSAVLYALIPASYLAFCIPKVAKKAALFSITISIPAVIIFDYLGHATNSWYIETIFQTRFLGLIPWESFLWGPSIVFFVIMFYEYFIADQLPEKLYQPRMKYFVLLCIFSTAAALVVFSAIPTTVGIPYFYLVSGLVFFLLPIVVELYEHPEYIRKLLETTAYYFYAGILYEITALRLEIWDFPGTDMDYIGWVHLAGVSFPFEELFFWLFLFGMAIIVSFDMWDDYETSSM